MLIQADEILGAEWSHGLELLCFLEMRPRGAVRIHNSLRQQIADGFAVPGNVSGEDMIEGAILADEHDDMLDGRLGLVMLLLVILTRRRSVCQSTTQ